MVHHLCLFRGAVTIWFLASTGLYPRVLAEDAGADFNGGGNGNNYNNNNKNNGNNDGGGNSQSFSMCADSPIVPDKLSILCDSPGQYYYGSTYYRNSAKCQAEDKARIQIQFEIVEDLASSAYLTVDVHGYGTVETVRLYDSVNICELYDLWSLDGQVCPNPGAYGLSAIFYWGSQNDEYSYSFRPKIEIGISSKQGSSDYDLGGANTEHCVGKTSWSNVQDSLSNTAKTFLITLGVIFGIVLFFWGGAWLIKRHMDEQEEPDDEENDKTKKLTNNEDNAGAGEDFLGELDIKKIAMMAREKDLIDA